MKLSLRALQEHLDFKGSAKELADTLSDLGFPNDGISHRGEGLDQVVVAKVLKKNKHPQADRLNLLTVDIGSEKLPIVCGAHNMSEGDFVALAPIGARVPGKDGSGLVMKEAKIRGETSKGMCCSEVELRLADESDGILLLSKEKVSDADLGRKVNEVLDLEDWVIEVDVTPNRPDALSVRGLAREAAAKLGIKLKSVSTIKWKTPATNISPSIENFADASGFAACLVQNVKHGVTAEKWKKFLEACGSRSISNLVDVSNIVLFSLGHPIHFFDADKVDAATIGVRRAKADEKLELLTGKTIDLTSDDLVIADKSGPLSLAGVMGGARTAVSDTTKNILIEVACFNPALIRATARRYELHSESSARFERGLTAFKLDDVMEHTLFLLKELSSFDSAQGTKIIDRNLSMKEVLWDRKRIEGKIGKIIKTDDELFELLRRLEYGFEPKGSAVRVTFPWYRVDVEFLEDVMEDIARLVGYENLERKPLRSEESKVAWKDISSDYRLADKVLDDFVAAGFSEVIQMSFTSAEVDKKLGFVNNQFVEVENPIHSEKSVLRRNLLSELIGKAKMNAAHGEDEIRLVELGPTYRAETGLGIYEESPKSELLSLACVWLLRPQDKKYLWLNSADPYFEFKGLLEKIWAKYKGLPARGFEAPAFFPKRSISFAHGAAGELHPSLMKAMDLSGRCFVGEWVLQLRPEKIKYESPTVFPVIDMDASFAVSKELTVAEFLDVFKKAKVPHLEWVRPYDLFEPEDLKPNKKSVTFAMRYRDLNRTLTLEEAKKSHEELVGAALKSLARYEVALR